MLSDLQSLNLILKWYWQDDNLKVNFCLEIPQIPKKKTKSQHNILQKISGKGVCGDSTSVWPCLGRECITIPVYLESGHLFIVRASDRSSSKVSVQQKCVAVTRSAPAGRRNVTWTGGELETKKLSICAAVWVMSHNTRAVSWYLHDFIHGVL